MGAAEERETKFREEEKRGDNWQEMPVPERDATRVGEGGELWDVKVGSFDQKGAVLLPVHPGVRFSSLAFATSHLIRRSKQTFSY